MAWYDSEEAGGTAPAEVPPGNGWLSDTGSQTIASGSLAPLSWPSVDEDTSDYFDAGAPTRLTIPAGKGGVYLLEFGAQFSASAAGDERVFNIRKNDSLLWQLYSVPRASFLRMEVMRTFRFVDDDYIHVQAYQDSGGDLDVFSARHLRITRLSA